MEVKERMRLCGVVVLTFLSLVLFSSSISAVTDDPFAYTLNDLKTGVSVSLEVGESIFWETPEGKYEIRVVASDGKQTNVSVVAGADYFSSSLRLGQEVTREIPGGAVLDYSLTFEAVQASLIVLQFQLLESAGGISEEDEDTLTIERTIPPISDASLLENGSRKLQGAPIRGMRVSDAEVYVEVPRSWFSLHTFYIYRLEIIVFLFVSFGILVLIAVISWILKNQREAVKTQSFFAPAPGRSY